MGGFPFRRHRRARLLGAVRRCLAGSRPAERLLPAAVAALGPGRDLENLCHVVVARRGVHLGPAGIEDVHLDRPEVPDHHRLTLEVSLGEVREVDAPIDVMLHQESAERGLAKGGSTTARCRKDESGRTLCVDLSN